MTASADEHFQAASGLSHVHFVGRGTTALWAALRALAPAGAEVLVPANVCEVVAAAILYARMSPRYVDVDPISGMPTAAMWAQAWRPACHVLLAVHNFGTPLPVDALVPWARERGLAVIEDCCNALGTTWCGRPVGTFGDAAVFSFGRGKIIDLACGGAIAARDRDLVAECRKLTEVWRPLGPAHAARDAAFQSGLRVARQYRELRDPAIWQVLYERYRPALLASAPPELADRLRVVLPTLDEIVARRRERAAECRQRLADTPIVHRPTVAGDAYWRYTCHVPVTDRDRVVTAVRRAGLPISTWYSSLHRFFPSRQSLAELRGAYAFEKTVVNLFVGDDTDDATVQATCVAIELALATPVEAGA